MRGEKFFANRGFRADPGLHSKQSHIHEQPRKKSTQLIGIPRLGVDEPSVSLSRAF